VGIYSSSSSTATMLMFKASRKQRAFALVNATRGKCALTCAWTLFGVASPASQNLRPSAKNACAAARASSGVTEINSAASSCKPCSWARARSPAYWIKSLPWIFLIHLAMEPLGDWVVSLTSSSSIAPSVCWRYCWTAPRCLHVLWLKYPLQVHLITVPFANTWYHCSGAVSDSTSNRCGAGPCWTRIRPVLLRRDFLAQAEELAQTDRGVHGHIGRQLLDMLGKAVVEDPLVAIHLRIRQLHMPRLHNRMEQAEGN